MAVTQPDGRAEGERETEGERGNVREAKLKKQANQRGAFNQTWKIQHRGENFEMNLGKTPTPTSSLPPTRPPTFPTLKSSKSRFVPDTDGPRRETTDAEAFQCR